MKFLINMVAIATGVEVENVYKTHVLNTFNNKYIKGDG